MLSSRRYIFKAIFQKSFDKLIPEKQELVLKALEALDSYFSKGTASFGLHIKRLHDGGSAKTHEARVNIDLRILWVETKDEIVFALLGNHDDVRRFIKNL